MLPLMESNTLSRAFHPLSDFSVTLGPKSSAGVVSCGSIATCLKQSDGLWCGIHISFGLVICQEDTNDLPGWKGHGCMTQLLVFVVSPILSFDVALWKISEAMRKVPVFKKHFLIRSVALATAGSGLLCSSIDTDLRTSISLAIPSPLLESLSWPWRTLREMIARPSYVSLDPTQYEDISKGVAGEVGDGANTSRGCLGRDSIANAAARVGPAVVNLSVPRDIYGLTMGKSVGSGTIIDSDGTILTCAHVVVDFKGLRSPSEGKVDVTLQDGRTFEGTVLNADLHSDIAIVKINSKTPLPMAQLGSSSKLRPGDWVVAMGCPLSLQNTVTAGIVSCVDRNSSDLGLGGMRREYLQTDCAINGGNSGGPLANIDGEVVGINVMKVAAADGLSFAVPIDSVSTIVEHFKKNGRVVRPWLGLKMLDLNHMIVAQLREKDDTFPNVNKGILVPMGVRWWMEYARQHKVKVMAKRLGDGGSSGGGGKWPFWPTVAVKVVVMGSDFVQRKINGVTPGSPADRAGFHPGDVVVEFDGRPVGSIKEVIEIMGDKVGKPLKAVVKRANDSSATLTVIPEEANPDM
ncbi:hypothetical protein RHSIM_Rhsim07G0186700 [Rhododendron simsii]|uniref:PDZ domain-containing protein n=1 Tax=Rhododendron simsii TaxID=118357 RepID=A0A834GNS7_RHOSS|nr:hypothetical protein RHSIM_Rhsim07G0186700 [Rhododendron simsii]